MATELIKNLSNELKPKCIQNSRFWNDAIRDLTSNPDKILPVFVMTSESGQEMGDFFLQSLPPTKESKLRLQVQGFSNSQVQCWFVSNSSHKWTTIQPGIFRFELKRE